VPVQAVSETALLDALNRGASGEVNMTTTLTDSVARRSYTVSSSTAGRTIEGRYHADVTSIVFIVTTMSPCGEIAELLISTIGGSRNLCLGAGIPVAPVAPLFVLSGARRHASGSTV